LVNSMEFFEINSGIQRNFFNFLLENGIGKTKGI
jgi:hypothetical protein